MVPGYGPVLSCCCSPGTRVEWHQLRGEKMCMPLVLLLLLPQCDFEPWHLWGKLGCLSVNWFLHWNVPSLSLRTVRWVRSDWFLILFKYKVTSNSVAEFISYIWHYILGVQTSVAGWKLASFE
jgi:hypothetical protein